MNEARRGTELTGGIINAGLRDDNRIIQPRRTGREAEKSDAKYSHDCQLLSEWQLQLPDGPHWQQKQNHVGNRIQSSRCQSSLSGVRAATFNAQIPEALYGTTPKQYTEETCCRPYKKEGMGQMQYNPKARSGGMGEKPGKKQDI